MVQSPWFTALGDKTIRVTAEDARGAATQQAFTVAQAELQADEKRQA